MFPKVARFSEVAEEATGGRPESDQWDNVTPQWFEMAGRPEGIWALQDALQPLYSVERDGSI
ncbi:MAG: hypothetical protein LBF42_02500 [Puniceicoccales bacterium]|jgi:hypothetical protein|nr:hypothetical protein [Puniceicoccales bacterium]